MTPDEAFEKALSLIGPLHVLADHLGITKGAVGQWKLEGRRVPAEHCPIIERLTDGAIRCEELRPDVDWAYLRNTSPEVSTALIPGRVIDGAVVRETIGKTRRGVDQKDHMK